ncbi:glycosyltransferase family 2 protein [Sulfobacillus harzensis]|uniref:Glycosyltransferase n=1 Tax=Sulfobacillus harzensis TaxID=2729629 RepID=A0A7Y0L075_9FIRM|nr:glycosyltransferase [Sulfobacillus harzensis]NMP20873.1 glycosyltransferase [Sulfobacillus harzensis]
MNAQVASGSFDIHIEGHVSLIPYHTADGGLVDPVDRSLVMNFERDALVKHRVIPLAKPEDRLWVGLEDPKNRDSVMWLQSLGIPVKAFLVQEWELTLAFDRVYGLTDRLVDRQLGGILLQQSKVHADQLVEALEMQAAMGARLGEVLTSFNMANFWDVAEALALQSGLPLVELASSGLTAPPDVWDAMDEAFWLRNAVVPIFQSSNQVGIAMVDPWRPDVVNTLVDSLGCPVLVYVTGYRDVLVTYSRYYGNRHATRSREQILVKRPDQSADYLLSRRQKTVSLAATTAFVLFMIKNWLVTLTFLNAVVEVLYALNTVYRLWLMFVSAKEKPYSIVRPVSLSGALSEDQLPIYTILVPLYKEAAVLPKIAQSISELRYPKHLLDVKFLLEADDLDTMEAARAAHLPNFIQIVIVPTSMPRTKPKACNYGFWQARGDFVVIFDAEDAPDPDQLLKAIEVFRVSDERVACVQAKLSYYNQTQNILTRWFTSEYAMWFDQLLPALFARNLPIPLGGTSNHFRVSVLKEIGAWDPFNVTEDADLGIRLARLGYRTVVMDSTTWEEANSDFVNWIRQRSRWVKGYIQTWIVHMRHPRRLVKELGWGGMMAFQSVIFGTPFTFLINPFLWGMTTVWFLLGVPFAHALFPAWVYYAAFLNLVFGNFAFMYTNVTGLATRRDWDLSKYATLNPVYWTFMSIAGWKGFLQLFTRPSYWEKTVHGLTDAKMPHERQVG